MARASITAVVAKGDRRQSLIAMRNRLASEANDVTWAKHKAECRCSCGMGDGRVLVALVKELRAVIAELEALPAPAEESTSDQLAARRQARIADAAGL